MARMKVYYEFGHKAMHPITMVVSFKIGELNWHKDAIYLPLIAPFQSHMLNEMNLSMAITVLLEDLTIHPTKTNYIGLYLPRIQARYEQLIDIHFIEHFIIRLADVEEVMQADVRRYFPADRSMNRDS
ncbi:hypothetical protein E0485_23095 [Paenibacillus albiflavus]|uniref:Uncharacterized protein n=1 Tax=Paenibacillus albiflavus TaxID=2545760 RepID=A0A4R4DYR4_9BACL|nr:hypothetical protein [Paenibacillus albiflavus]TCZ70977.1 hypothetical protein E0485_23095 [Paenibacillus albiflavus]